MHTFIANYDGDIFATKEEIEEHKQKVQRIFNLPFPDQLKVTLSKQSVQKISRFYNFMNHEKITKMDFYIGHDKDVNYFEPMNNHICFSNTQYIDYGDRLFNTFSTDSCLVTINKLRCSVLFLCVFSNSYMEECFDFTLDIQKILEVA